MILTAYNQKVKLFAGLILSLSLLNSCETQDNTAEAAATTAASKEAPAEISASETLVGETLSQTAATSEDPVTLRVGATPVPAAELLEFVKPILAEKGINLVISEFTDYVTPNIALGEGSLDANLYQHVPYLETFQKNNPLDIVSVRAIYLPPLSLYSDKVENIADIPDGATIAIPNDPSNEYRALLLLEKAGLIELKADAEANSGLDAIANNPKNLNFLELEAAQLPRSLADTDASIINTNYALEVNLNPSTDSLIHEDKDSPYANVLATTEGNLDNPNIIALADVLTSQEVKNWILEKYQGSIIPVF